MNRHMQRKHNATYKDEKTLSARTICFYPNCNEEYFHKSKYIEHFSEKHHVDFQTIEKNFTNMQEFLSWKEKEESENFLYFSKQRVLAVAKLQVICIMFVNMMVTVKLIVEKKNLTAKLIKDIIMEKLRESHFVLLE